MRDKIFLPCLDIRDRFDSFQAPQEYSVPSHVIFVLLHLADVSHLGLLLSVHILFSMRAKSSFSLLSNISSLPSKSCTAALLHQQILLFAISSSSYAAASALLLQSFNLFPLPSSSTCAASQFLLPSHLLLLHACQRTSLQVHHIFAPFRGFFLLTRDLRLIQFMLLVSCIVYFCENFNSDLTVSSLLS